MYGPEAPVQECESVCRQGGKPHNVAFTRGSFKA